jgi:hypothetical protein
MAQVISYSYNISFLSTLDYTINTDSCQTMVTYLYLYFSSLDILELFCLKGHTQAIHAIQLVSIS